METSPRRPGVSCLEGVSKLVSDMGTVLLLEGWLGRFGFWRNLWASKTVFTERAHVIL